ncbi:hypothetical protein [Lacipirellula parvula]|uniref:Uncharacterized protein n=1 Tax=Lacipirellula parvula TaxID=2650471 RepID=A0A5K7X778_9BACT|nr:hypothetical protein [Lacipirellula parvula]BBO32408.1 hypothetical protein PLANPX_2020 [Lacipirellula parvula]
MKFSELLTACSLPPMLLGAAMLVSLGCENKEKVLEVETPNRTLEVERDRDTGDVDVDVDRKDEKAVDINLPGVDVEVNK